MWVASWRWQIPDRVLQGVAQCYGRASPESRICKESASICVPELRVTVMKRFHGGGCGLDALGQLQETADQRAFTDPVDEDKVLYLDDLIKQ